MKMPSNMQHTFAQIPQANIPRSTFSRSHGYKTTFDSGYLVPFFLDEVLPGDTFAVNATLFARLSTPFVPVMDNLKLDVFYFFVPNRLVWFHWVNFMGEEATPGDYVNSVVNYLTPLVTPPAGGWTTGSLADYFGLPIGIQNLHQINGTVAFPFRAYNLIWNDWFRDENLQGKINVPADDGPDPSTNYTLRRRGKRHDYFTSALPWPQKGPAATIPLTGQVPVIANPNTTYDKPNFYWKGDGTATSLQAAASGTSIFASTANPAGATRFLGWQAGYDATTNPKTGLVADLGGAGSSITATINALRQAFQLQRLYERDARGGSRYTEIVRSHFGVISPDARLQRPEYLGGGSQAVNISPIAQTSASNTQPTPQGNLAAIGTTAGRHGFVKSFTEHGWIMGLLSVRADLSYQQCLNRQWFRRTRFDYYWPVLQGLGEQVITNDEIYPQGTATDIAAFGYQERWAEYRYKPSLITGKFRSNAATPLDVWHLAQKFTALPTLGDTFIQDTPPVNRILAVPTQPEFLLDSYIDVKATRPMPVYSVPGYIDHF